MHFQSLADKVPGESREEVGFCMLDKHSNACSNVSIQEVVIQIWLNKNCVPKWPPTFEVVCGTVLP